MASPGWRIRGDYIYTAPPDGGKWRLRNWIQRLRYMADGCVDVTRGDELREWANGLEKIDVERRAQKRP